MKKLGFLIIFWITAQLGASPSPQDWQHDLDVLEQYYTEGKYSEIMVEDAKLLTLLKKQSAPLLTIRAQLLLAKTYYTVFSFAEAERLLQEILTLLETLSSSQERAEAHLFLAEYYNEIEAYELAAKAHVQCNLLASQTQGFRAHAYEAAQAKFLIEQNYFFRAEKSIKQLDTLLAQTKIAQVSNDSATTLKERKNYYVAQAALLKMTLLIQQGRFKEALKLQLTPTVWKTQVQAHSAYLEQKAELFLQRKDYDQALSTLKTACFILNTSEFQKQKIRLYLKVANLSSLVGDKNTYDQYIRHLQMYADRNLNKYNGYELAHQYAQAFSLYAEGDYVQAQKKLDRFKDKFEKLPENHYYRKEYWNLSRHINQENLAADLQSAIYDSLAFLSKRYVGDHPSYFFLKLSGLNQIPSNPGLIAESILWLKEQFPKYIQNNSDTCSKIHHEYLKALSKLYFSTDQFMLAAETSGQAVAMADTLYGQDSWEYIKAALQLAQLQIYAGKYTRAKDIYKEMKGKTKLMALASHRRHEAEYYTALATLAETFGDIDLNKKWIFKVQKLIIAQGHYTTLFYQNIQEKLADIYLASNNPSTAERLLLNALNIKSIKFGTLSPTLLPSYKALAQLYTIQGNYTKAEKNIAHYNEIIAQTFGENSLLASDGLLVWANYGEHIGDIEKAVERVETAEKIQKKLLGIQHHLLSVTYLNMVHLKLNMHQTAAIDIYLAKAGAIMELTLGKENQLYAQYLYTKADWYLESRKYEQALELLGEAEKFWQGIYGAKNVHIAEINMAKGHIAYSKGLYEEAERQYLNSKELYASIFSTKHPSHTLALAKLAKVYFMQHRHDKSLELMEVCMPQYLEYVNKYFPTLSFQEKSKFWASMKEEFEFYNFLILNAIQTPSAELLGNVYNSIIATKALLLSSDIKLRRQIMESQDSTLIKYFEEWIAQKELYTSLLSTSKEQIQEQGLNLAQIQSRVEQLEKNMGERSELFSKNKESKAPTWKAIQAELKQRQYAVEIVRYRTFDKVFTDSVVYAALILGKESTQGPKLVTFNHANEMENKYYRYYVNSIAVNSLDKYAYKIFWKPIKSEIPDSALVYMSSEGIFNQINLEMLQNLETRRYVIDENEIVYLTNTKDIIPFQKLIHKGKQAAPQNLNSKFVICGNPKFYVSTNAEDQTISSLSGAEKEARDIGTLVEGHQKNSEVLVSDAITEASVLSVKKPLVLHIATHGFFKETNSDDPKSKMTNPLFNSGILLTGAGDELFNRVGNSHKGILTAYEAMDMDLDQTEMVVLSACETGKGKVQVGEGVMGLQRSFLVAGAQCVVISLFKVNDDITHDLMLSFYENWILTKDKRHSFNEAKKKIKAKYSNPMAWGSFIMIEGRARQ